MLSQDIANAIPDLLVIFSSLIVITLLVLTIPSFFYPVRTRDSPGRYQIYSYIVMSINVIISSLTYLVLYTNFIFTKHLTLCAAFFAIQRFTEGITMFFTIGMSMCLLLHIFPSYKKCQCHDTKNIGKAVFWFWVPAGIGYSLFFLLFDIFRYYNETGYFLFYNMAICSMFDEPELMSYYMHTNYAYWHIIIHKVLRLLTMIVTLICAVLCRRQLKKQEKMCKDAYRSTFMLSDTGQDVVISSLNRLEKKLLDQYVTLTIVCWCREIMTILALIIDVYVSYSLLRYFLVLADIADIITSFLSVATFTKGFLKRFVNHVWNKISACYHNRTMNISSSKNHYILKNEMILN